MAKKQMTLEKKLEEAIVNDIPYEVPDNWIRTKLGYISDIKTGRKDANHGTEDGKYPFYTCASEPIKSPTYTFDGEYIILPGNGANVGMVLQHNGKFEAYQRTYTLKIKKILRKYIYYNLLFGWKAYNENKQFGSATNYIKLGNITEYEIVIPPMLEQERIVDKIESLFEKLDKAKELIEEARDEFENRKAAILEKAFCGALTKNHKYENDDLIGKDYLNNIAQLRENKYKELLEKSKLNNSKNPKKPHKIDLEFEEISKGWIKTKLYNLIYDFKYGTSLKSDYENEGKPVIRIPNLDNGYINHSDMKYLKEVDIDENNKVEAGDIVIIRSNGSPLLVGKTSIITEIERDFAFASYLIRIRGIGIEPKYLYYVLNSNMVKSQFLSKSKSTSGINNINTEELGSSIIPVPAISEQRKIVKILDSLLEEEEKLAELTKLEEQIELIKKAILAKAFRGELGTNNPEEESAIELLKEILSEK
ncbi:MAG: restriction endonuclease subunit S [Sarcina sp.]